MPLEGQNEDFQANHDEQDGVEQFIDEFPEGIQVLSRGL